MIGLFGTFQPQPRPFAVANAVAYQEHESGGPEVKEPPTQPDAPEPPPPEPVPPPGGAELVAQGEAVFMSKGCMACHTIEGVLGAVGQVGPELTNVATNAATRKPPLSAGEYIRESVENPTVFVVDGFGPLMPSLRDSMTDAEFESLIVFLLTQQ